MNIKKGDKFIVVEDISTHALIHWKAPFTDGVNCVIPKGTVLVAYADSMPFYDGFGCLPENENEFEKKIIPEETRLKPKYAGYSLAMTKKDMEKIIRKIN